MAQIGIGGNSVDCFGWGERITMLGDGREGTGTTTYVADFGGTSGASPIVAGAAKLAQQKAKRDLGALLSPRDMPSRDDRRAVIPPVEQAPPDERQLDGAAGPAPILWHGRSACVSTFDVA